MNDILKKGRVKPEKMKANIFNYLSKIASAGKDLITKTRILSDHENSVFILIYKIFSNV